MKAFTIGEASPYTHRTIPRDVAERAITEYKEKFVSQKRAFGEATEDGNWPDLSVVNLTNVSHTVTDIQIEGNDVMVNATILDTPKGLEIQQLLDNKCPLRIGWRGIGCVDETNTVKDEGFELVSFDILRDDEPAIER